MSGFRGALVRLLGGTMPKAVPGLREAAGVTIDGDEHEGRPLSGNTRRDLTPLTQHRMQRLAAGLWETNLLARQLIELPIAYLLAEGVRITVPDPDAQTWVDAWWNDPVTDMPLRLPELMRALALTGEAAWPVFAHPISGHVRLGYLDPARIATVVADPENASRPIGVVTKRDAKGRTRRYRVVLGGPETALGEAARRIRETMTGGDIHYFRANALAGGGRGRSDLLAAIDWLDAYERYLYGEIDRAGYLRSHVWDVTIAGVDEKEVEKRAREIAALPPGNVRIHNDSETWQALAPKLGAHDANAGARLYRNHILGGMALAEHWFGGGGDVNRATAAEMGEPAWKSLRMRQRLWTEILRRAAGHVIQSRLDPSGRSVFDPENPDPDLTPSVEWPEMVVRDASRHATALAQTTGAVAVALDRGLLSETTALRLIRSLAERLGVEFEAEAELEAARADAERRAETQSEADSFPAPPEDADGGED